MKVLIVLAAVLALVAGGRVDPTLKNKLHAGQVLDIILELPSIRDQVKNNAALQALTGDAKVDALVATLKGLTGAAQAPYIAVTKDLKLETEQFWVSNIVLIKNVNAETLAKLANMKGEFTLREQNYVSAFPAVVHNTTVEDIHQTYQWGVNTIRAPAAHTAGHRGDGVRVCIIDTGVNLNHEALRDSFNGGWHDPNHGTAGPTDQHGHGTHCAGTILGRTNGIGVAPGATWSGCRGLSHQGSGSEATLNSCAQETLTWPPNQRPHIVSNSWGGGSGSTWYQDSIDNWRDAGIIPVFAIGNSGSNCRTANSPGDQLRLISVGATTNTDAMATFSSRGPSTTGLLKPEVSAPGNQIVSAGTGTNNYVTMSGTSMATPHVAGAVALYMGANPGATFDQIFRALTTTGAHPTLSNSDRNCGLPDGTDFPNHAYGHGRIDIAAALGL